MKAVLYYKKPSGSGAMFPISASEIASIRCLENAWGIRGPMENRQVFRIKNISIVADEQVDGIIDLKNPECFESFEEFLWSVRGELHLTHNL